MTPLKRFINLLKLDKKDIVQIFFYAIFAGIVSLSLPLGIQAIINFIQAGRISASWIVLVVLVVFGVAFVGVLSLMQLRITENLQQKIFVRAAFEFAYRIPKFKFEEIYNKYSPEIANRFFDTLNIQKGTSKLLIDFSAALLQITFGLILLSLYHPFFIIFGMLLMVLLYFIFKFSYIPGLESSLKESKFKYKVAAWLQELARNSNTFKRENHFEFALNKNDKLVNDYINYREKHFNIIKKQFLQLITFKVIITASLLLIGGFLVMQEQMNIGQFVAAEIIILLVINSVEKIILGLETFYDVLTSVEKIGQVTDIELEFESTKPITECYNSISLEAEKIKFRFPDSKENILDEISIKIEQGEKIVIEGDNGSGKTTLIKLLSGTIQPTYGALYINDDTFRKIDLNQYRTHIATVLQDDTLFEGTIKDNLTFGNYVSNEDIKWALDAVQLTNFIKTLPNGLDTKIYPEGKQLSASNAQKILLARSIIAKPKILFLEDPTDKMDNETSQNIISFLTDVKNKWTLVVTSREKAWEKSCNRIIYMEDGKINKDVKKQ